LRADIEAYCEISCEGEKVRSPTADKTPNPEWNTFAIFYRRQPLKKPIRVDVSIALAYKPLAVGRICTQSLSL